MSTRYFAEVKGGTVVSVFPWDADGIAPEYTDRVAVDVTSADPRPEPGWVHDQITGGFAAPEEADHIRVVAVLSGGDELTPPGILNDGTQTLHADITLTDKSGNVLSITDYYRMPIRRDDGSIKECIRIDFVNGVASVDYTATGETGFYSIWESDFWPQPVAPGVVWPMRLAGDTRFRIYRTL